MKKVLMVKNSSMMPTKSKKKTRKTKMKSSISQKKLMFLLVI